MQKQSIRSCTTNIETAPLYCIDSPIFYGDRVETSKPYYLIYIDTKIFVFFIITVRSDFVNNKRRHSYLVIFARFLCKCYKGLFLPPTAKIFTTKNGCKKLASFTAIFKNLYSNSMIAISAASPRRAPVLMMRVYPPLRSAYLGAISSNNFLETASFVTKAKT